MNGDPLAAALGNATLLGVGYLLLRRWWLAAAAVAGSAVLLVVVATAGQPGWTWRAMLLLWWVAMVVHGWRLAGGRRPQQPRPASPVRRQRAIAAGAAAAVLLVAIGLGLDTRRIEAAADAHRANDCGEVAATLDRIGPGHRVVAPLVAERAERAEREAAAACERMEVLLAAATAALGEAVTGDTDALESGFDTLATVLAESPARAEDVNRVVDGYLDQLAAAPACDARSNIDWFHAADGGGAALDRMVGALAEVAPPLLAGCGDELLDDDPSSARDAYQTVLDRYPAHPLAETVGPNIEQADELIEQEEVSRLLDGWPDRFEVENRPPYCDEPAGYRGAPPYTGRGPHPVAAFGSFGLTSVVPVEWRADDLEDAALVMCGEGLDDGTRLGTCDYVTERWGPITVDLYSKKFQILAYELHTGELVLDETIEYGSGCPAGVLDFGIQPNRVAAEGNAVQQVRAVVEALVFPQQRVR